MVGSNTYGKWLKAAREAAGMTQQELADAAFMTRSHISHIEAGRRLPSKEDAQRLDKALGTGNVLTSFLPERPGEVADYFEAARELEQQATEIREFALSCVPGLLQTEPYARAILDIAYPRRTDKERKKYLAARLTRAKLLADSVTPMVWALLDENVLRRPVGGPEAMAEQIMHMVSLAESGRIRVHVLPYGIGAHALMQAFLTLMWFEDQPPAAYSEGAQVGKVHDSPSVVQRLQGMYDLALGDALSQMDSLALMRAAAKDYGHHG